MEFKLATKTGCLLWVIVGIILGLLGLSMMLLDPFGNLVSYMLRMRKGNMVHDLWKNIPVDIKLSVYIFNVTNAENYLKGIDDKIKVEEIGPYVFKEIRTNDNITYNDNGTVSFVPNISVVSVPELSVGDIKKDRIICVNIPLLGMLSYALDESAWKRYALNGLIWSLKSEPFLNLTIDEYMHGYDDQLVYLVSSIYPNWLDFTKFGIFDRIYAKRVDVMTMDLEKYNTYNIRTNRGFEGFNQWGFEDHNTSLPCNSFENVYEGILFPQNLQPEREIKLYKRPFCRAMRVEYNQTVMSKLGVEAYEYILPLDTYSCTNPDNECFCSRINYPISEGMTDVKPCYYEIPLAISQPHFYGSSETFIDNLKVIGMKPDAKYVTRLYVQPKLGISVDADMKVQVNLLTRKYRVSSRIDKLRDMILPILWVQLTMDNMPYDLKFKIIFSLNYLPTIQKGLGLIFIFLGMIVCIYKSFGFVPAPIITPAITSLNYTQVPLNEKIEKRK